MKSVAYLFPGQGSQYIKMGKELYDSFHSAKLVFEEASDAIGKDMKKLCFEESIEELTKTENTQPAILTVSVASFRVFSEEFQRDPVCGAGHSLGEISALTCSDAIQFGDAVKIVQQRGRFMQDAVAFCDGAMAAISGVSKDDIDILCNEVTNNQKTVVISNFNSPKQTVISGHKNAVSDVAERIEKMGGRVVPLKVSAPFHSPLMMPAAEKLRAELLKYTYSNMKWPVISNVSAAVYKGKEEIISMLTEQMVKPVRWQESIAYMQDMGIDTVIELGPGNVLKNLMKSNSNTIKAFSFDNRDDKDQIKKEIDLMSQNQEKYSVVSKCLAIAVSTKNRNWDNDEYTKGVVEPYRRIKRMQESVEKDRMKPTKEQMVEALNMLKSVFETKKTPKEEQQQRFSQLLEETNTTNLLGEYIK